MGNVEKLIKKLTDKKAEIRKTAIIELGNLGDLKAVDPLITRLKDDDEDVRLWAAASLGKLGDERALEPLVTVVMNDNEKVRKEAAGAVVRIVPSFDDVNIDEVIKKIEEIYKEFKIDKEREEEQVARTKDFELEKELNLEKQVQEKYYEELQSLQKEKQDKEVSQSVSKPKKVKTPLPPPPLVVPTTRPIVESIEREQEVEEKEEQVPEISINEFMSALKRGTVEERIDELSNVVARAMDLFVTAIDDITMKLNDLENRMEQKFQNLVGTKEGIPVTLPTLGTDIETKLKAPTSISVLPTRAALNEELKKVLNKRKIEG